jgi:capsular polysaccharide biosynthesis protein
MTLLPRSALHVATSASRLSILLTVAQDERSFAPPPSVTPNIVRAMMWNWPIVLVCVVVFTSIGGAVALLRSPSYTATAKLSVGRIDITSPGALSGYAVATQALATGYSRTVTALPVVKPVSEKTGLSVNELQESLIGTPVAESPIFKLEAEASSEDQAVEVVNEASRSLVRYAAQLNQNNPDSARLYRQYRTASVLRKIAKQELHTAQESAASTPSASEAATIARAQSNFDAANLKVNAVGMAYTASVQSQAATQLVQILSPATRASSDRVSTLTILLFIGLVVGLLVGGAIAAFREARLTRIGQ